MQSSLFLQLKLPSSSLPVQYQQHHRGINVLSPAEKTIRFARDGSPRREIPYGSYHCASHFCRATRLLSTVVRFRGSLSGRGGYLSRIFPLPFEASQYEGATTWNKWETRTAPRLKRVISRPLGIWHRCFRSLNPEMV